MQYDMAQVMQPLVCCIGSSAPGVVVHLASFPSCHQFSEYNINNFNCHNGNDMTWKVCYKNKNTIQMFKQTTGAIRSECMAPAHNRELLY